MFGLSVVIEGDIALVGSPGDDAACPANPDCGSGAVYVYQFDPEKSRWDEVSQLTASDGAMHDGFGVELSMSGDLALIGATGDDDASGSAYVFRFDRATSAWIEQAKLAASDGAASDVFGISVAIHSGLAVVGTPWDDDAGSLSGSAYVFGGLSDCNGNGALDACDIADGSSEDLNGDGMLDECACPWDLTGDGVVNVLDLIELLFSFGPCDDPNDCPADFNEDGFVNVLELIELIDNAGPCPGFDECPWDIDGDGEVGSSDLVSELQNLGPCDDPANCPWDFNGDDVVDGADVLALVVNFGPCP